MTDIFQYGFDPEFYGAAPETAARIVGVFRERYAIISQHGEGFAKLKRSTFAGSKDAVYPTIGDFVEVAHNDSGDSLILRTLARRSFFVRSDGYGSRGVQAVATNIDYALLATSCNRDFNLRRLERYLSQAFASGAQPVVLLTKADLCSDSDDYADQVHAIAPDVPVIVTSAKAGTGLASLVPYLQPGKTLVLLGMSGVGKSSITNALLGREHMPVNRTRDIDSAKGRHTTTHRELLLLPSGALLIDTPGMRELGIYDAEEGVAQTFEEIESLACSCRFSDCKHQSEPGCAVKAALENGTLDAKRLKNYFECQHQAGKRHKY